MWVKELAACIHNDFNHQYFQPFAPKSRKGAISADIRSRDDRVVVTVESNKKMSGTNNLQISKEDNSAHGGTDDVKLRPVLQESGHASKSHHTHGPEGRHWDQVAPTLR